MLYATSVSLISLKFMEYESYLTRVSPRAGPTLIPAISFCLFCFAIWINMPSPRQFVDVSNVDLARFLKKMRMKTRKGRLNPI